jgi:hypothetical protein
MAPWVAWREAACAAVEGENLKEDERRVAAAAVEFLPPRLDHCREALEEGCGCPSVCLALVPERVSYNITKILCGKAPNQ